MPSLLYIGQNPGQGTGSPVIVFRHLQRLAAAGWSIEILADYGGDYRACRTEGWTVHPLRHRRWWWPPYRPQNAGLRWLRLRLLAREVAAAVPAPTAMLGYLAAHSNFSADLATHAARITGAPLHLLVHDDAAAFPAGRGQEARLRRAQGRILRRATMCWFSSPELADCHPDLALRRRVLYPLPEGWNRPAFWQSEFAVRPRIYYAGYVWPEQLPLLAQIGEQVRSADSRLVMMARDSLGLRALCAARGVSWQPPFAANREALAHLAANAAALLVSYAHTVAAMPWSATSFPSKLVEYCHLGLPIAIVAPADTAVARWARRMRFPHWFEPSDLRRLHSWLMGLRDPAIWRERAALSWHLARTEFDPVRIQQTLTEALGGGSADHPPTVQWSAHPFVVSCRHP